MYHLAMDFSSQDGLQVREGPQEVCEFGSFKDRDFVRFLCNFLKGG